ncbi:MAG: YlmC/YmxH family sporulation protein [Oscillospiraceae bacterium]|nr:YlmC/YmxH family sporulation protein [Oscillospiraceae bacterium]
MTYRIADLRCREVINIRTGFRLGYVCDALFNIETGQLISLVVPGPFRFLGIFGRRDDYIVPWECVKRVGDDIILIDAPEDQHWDYDRKEKRRRFW